jgi:hypothetical protein
MQTALIMSNGSNPGYNNSRLQQPMLSQENNSPTPNRRVTAPATGDGVGTPRSNSKKSFSSGNGVASMNFANDSNVNNGHVTLIALYTYDSRADGDLSFRKGDQMILYDDR